MVVSRVRLFLEIKITERLAVGVAHDKARF
jgi:hypothetical protein